MLNQGKKRGRETNVLALDCERILTANGERLARVSIVNFYGNVVFDTLVNPESKVEDYREWITGIKPSDMMNAPTFSKVAPILKKILINKIVVGHSLEDDFLALKLHECDFEFEVREISEFREYKRPIHYSSYSPLDSSGIFGGFEKRKLKDLAKEFLNATIQEGHHSSIIDARVALALYRMNQKKID